MQTSITIDFLAQLTGRLDLQSADVQATLRRSFALADGTGAGKADRMWTDRRTIAASGSEDIDLAGSLTDIFGQAVTFARIRGLIVAADKGNTNNVVIGGVTNGLSTILQPAASGLAVVRPGGIVAFIATDATAYAVTTGTADLLHVANSGAGSGVTYEIAVVGASA